nr:MAG TPA: hypothetical protein [Caudoviricetes sp.]
MYSSANTFCFSVIPTFHHLHFLQNKKLHNSVV